MGNAVVLALTVSFLSITTLQAQNRPALEAGELPRVVVLATGGTIATRFDPAVGVDLGLLTGEQIVAAAPGLAEVASVDVEQISNVGSRNMTPEIWRRLSSRVNELLSSPDVTGIVVTHGTDTLEETAFFLDLTVTSDKPVVLVGAQRAPTYFDTDGPRNLLDAVRVAVSEESVGMGTLVVMNGEINAAREVTKVHTLARETFRALEFGALGVADPGGVRFYRAPFRRQTIPLRETDRLGRVDIVTEYAGSDGRLIRLLVEDEAPDGIVIAGLGLGHVTSKTLAAIREARGRGIPVVLSTRVYTGRIVPLYAINNELLALGCVVADNLTPQKARILLMLALTRTRSSAELQAYFDR
jgi:L-asparaginase